MLTNVIELVLTAAVAGVLVLAIDFAFIAPRRDRYSMLSDLVHFLGEVVRFVARRDPRLPRARLIRR